MKDSDVERWLQSIDRPHDPPPDRVSRMRQRMEQAYRSGDADVESELADDIPLQPWQTSSPARSPRRSFLLVTAAAVLVVVVGIGVWSLRPGSGGDGLSATLADVGPPPTVESAADGSVSSCASLISDVAAAYEVELLRPNSPRTELLEAVDGLLAGFGARSMWPAGAASELDRLDRAAATLRASIELRDRVNMEAGRAATLGAVVDLADGVGGCGPAPAALEQFRSESTP